jgi:hypothetical protein
VRGAWERGGNGGGWGGIGAVISCWIRGEGRENYTLEERGAIYSRHNTKERRDIGKERH